MNKTVKIIEVSEGEKNKKKKKIIQNQPEEISNFEEIVSNEPIFSNPVKTSGSGGKPNKKEPSMDDICNNPDKYSAEQFKKVATPENINSCLDKYNNLAYEIGKRSDLACKTRIDELDKIYKKTQKLLALVSESFNSISSRPILEKIRDKIEGIQDYIIARSEELASESLSGDFIEDLKRVLEDDKIFPKSKYESLNINLMVHYFGGNAEINMIIDKPTHDERSRQRSVARKLFRVTLSREGNEIVKKLALPGRQYSGSTYLMDTTTIMLLIYLANLAGYKIDNKGVVSDEIYFYNLSPYDKTSIIPLNLWKSANLPDHFEKQIERRIQQIYFKILSRGLIQNVELGVNTGDQKFTTNDISTVWKREYMNITKDTELDKGRREVMKKLRGFGITTIGAGSELVPIYDVNMDDIEGSESNRSEAESINASLCKELKKVKGFRVSPTHTLISYQDKIDEKTLKFLLDYIASKSGMKTERPIPPTRTSWDAEARKAFGRVFQYEHEEMGTESEISEEDDDNLTMSFNIEPRRESLNYTCDRIKNAIDEIKKITTVLSSNIIEGAGSICHGKIEIYLKEYQDKYDAIELILKKYNLYMVSV